jgi:hypothetical protein
MHLKRGNRHRYDAFIVVTMEYVFLDVVQCILMGNDLRSLSENTGLRCNYDKSIAVETSNFLSQDVL